MCPSSRGDRRATPLSWADLRGSSRLVHVVVSYDVGDDRRRNRLAKLLVAYLNRVQFSVFEGEVHDAALPRLLEQAVDLIDHQCDSLRVYYLCKACVGRSVFFGTAPTWPSPEEDEVL